jgi:hypothetical protein
VLLLLLLLSLLLSLLSLLLLMLLCTRDQPQGDVDPNGWSYAEKFSAFEDRGGQRQASGVALCRCRCCHHRCRHRRSVLSCVVTCRRHGRRRRDAGYDCMVRRRVWVRTAVRVAYESLPEARLHLVSLTARLTRMEEEKVW